MGRLYTRTGDGGQTGLLGGLRLPKSHARFEVIGDLDELNAQLGVVIAQLQDARRKTLDVRGLFESIQSDLFAIGAYLAEPELPDTSPASKARIAELEALIDQFETESPPLLNFILPGGTVAAAHLHVARAVCRRAERSVVKLQEELTINTTLVAYLNRLADLLFAAGRAVTHRAKVPEITWRGT